jgi:hypothetical protein
MAITKDELIEKIKRRFGHPVVKVELDDTQIIDHIDFAVRKWKKWAVGAATVEKYMTLPLSAGQTMYDLPAEVVDVINYSTEQAGSINTLFTIENYLYNLGLYDFITHTQGEYSLLSYHIARNFLEDLRKYIPDAYNFRYHRYTNQIEIQPPPPSGGSMTIEGTNWNSPGIILLRTYVVETEVGKNLYDEDWIFDYSTALSKKSLGLIRRKFENFQSIGNIGLTMDGSSLIGEAESELERLEETLRTEEGFDGYGIELW